jgi:acetyltransferase-like isoleucine patch superfamily enzyme
LKPTIHPTAEVAKDARIGEDVRIWHQAQVREGARVGAGCVLGKGVYVDHDVVIGERCKLQNYAAIFHGATLEDGVFVGPHAVIANDRYPRAVNPDGTLKAEADWQVQPVLVRAGASLGAGSVVVPGLTIGPWAVVGAGAVVTANVPAHAIVRGNPARVAGWACDCGHPLRHAGTAMWHCDPCDRPYHLAELEG